jgi:hypothetical protein
LENAKNSSQKTNRQFAKHKSKRLKQS